MIYLYDTERKAIYESDSLKILNPTMMSNIQQIHKDDIKNNYGDIIINEETMTAEFKYRMVNITVDEEDNPVLSYDGSGVEVKAKDFYEALKEKAKGKIVKFINNEFDIRTITDSYTVYNPKMKTYTIDINRLRDYLVTVVSGCEQEIREHGYYYNFWPTTDPDGFVQPFRVHPDNDLQVIKSLRDDIPAEFRALKCFKTEGKVRATRVGSYKALKGASVIDPLLEYHIKMINAYSGFVKGAIYIMINKIKNSNNLNELLFIKDNYVNLLIKGMHDKMIKDIPGVEEIEMQLTELFKQSNIIPRVDLTI